jgi:hypothetical protein
MERKVKRKTIVALKNAFLFEYIYIYGIIAVRISLSSGRFVWKNKIIFVHKFNRADVGGTTHHRKGVFRPLGQTSIVVYIMLRGPPKGCFPPTRTDNQSLLSCGGESEDVPQLVGMIHSDSSVLPVHVDTTESVIWGLENQQD